MAERLARARETESAGQHFLNKLSKLKSFNKKSKQRSRASRQKFHWKEEYAKLRKQANHLDQDANAALLRCAALVPKTAQRRNERAMMSPSDKAKRARQLAQAKALLVGLEVHDAAAFATDTPPLKTPLM